MFIIPMSNITGISGLQTGLQVKSPEGGQSPSMPFSDLLGQAVQTYQDAQKTSDQDAYQLAMGQRDDLHNVMLNMEKATAALELTVQLTSRAVNAYNEIMRMQV